MVSSTRVFSTLFVAVLLLTIPYVAFSAATSPSTTEVVNVARGLAIDLYTQYPAPYGGQGPNMPSDMFAPQQDVNFSAVVTYNQYPVAQKLVGFHVRHQGATVNYDIYDEAATDGDGVARMTLRLPWPADDPVNEVFGLWNAIATVEVAEMVRNDTLAFWVWWKVQVVSVEPMHTEYVQRKAFGDPLDLSVELRTYSMQLLPVTLALNVYDQLGFFVGSDFLQATAGWGEYRYYNYLGSETPPAKSYPINITMPLSTYAVVGAGTAFGNAYDKFPWIGGTPYAPEAQNTVSFYIVSS